MRIHRHYTQASRSDSRLGARKKTGGLSAAGHGATVGMLRLQVVADAFAWEDDADQHALAGRVAIEAEQGGFRFFR